MGAQLPYSGGMDATATPSPAPAATEFVSINIGRSAFDRLPAPEVMFDRPALLSYKTLHLADGTALTFWHSPTYGA